VGFDDLATGLPWLTWHRPERRGGIAGSEASLSCCNRRPRSMAALGRLPPG
jgi:hypothetical protein